ncbi:MAG: DUF2326 domain-containing protein [Micrococcales bacterium]|nr:DUF2326 domain-containing protein [Micrococcales bacterium]
MFLRRLESSDERFKQLEFHDGLNLLVAERREEASQLESRNGTGKSLFVHLVRFLLGGDLSLSLKGAGLDRTFAAELCVPSGMRQAPVRVERSAASPNAVDVSGWEGLAGTVKIREWNQMLGRTLFGLRDEGGHPTVGELRSQLVREHYGDPLKINPRELDWVSAARVGYLLGLDQQVLNSTGELATLERQLKAVRKAIKDGVLRHLSDSEADLAAQLNVARARHVRQEAALAQFQVDEQYRDHQVRADELSARIEAINDEALALERRERELAAAISQEVSARVEATGAKVARAYEELGLSLPEQVVRRYDEVASFHEAVVRNRRTFLESAHAGVVSRLEGIAVERARLDHERSQVMTLLRQSVALETFTAAQQSLGVLAGQISALEERHADAERLAASKTELQTKTMATVALLRAERHERADRLGEATVLFNQLASEIYVGKDAYLTVEETDTGRLRIQPSLSGDGSDGVLSVETFLLDVVCLVCGIRNGRAPGFLVHDSQLFDGVDDRQVASCLNIGARLADEHGFQYIVTMNSDKLDSVVVQSEHGFAPDQYLLAQRLTDATEDGGLFGFRWE